MFFVLSKILAFLLSPFNIAVILGVLAAGIKKWRKYFALASLVVLLVFSNPLLIRLAVQWWEDKPMSLPKNNPGISNIVVLGGMSSFHEGSGRVRFWQSGDRFMQALLLWQQNPAKRIVISGGSPSIILDERGEGAFLKDFLLQIGVDDQFIAVDSLSRNTYENAVFTSKMFEINGWDKEIALVTSAWHIPRAQKCFEKQGFVVVPIGADPFYPFTPLTPRDVIIPSSGAFSTWELLIKEWVGFMVYRVRGYL